MIFRRSSGLLIGITLAAGLIRAAEAPPLPLALEREGQHHLAALEYRRLAHGEPDAANAGRWYWLAAHAYAAGNDWPLVGRMLDQAEDLAPLELSVPVSWLRAEQALAERDWPSAEFYFESLGQNAGETAWRDVALRGRATARLHRGDVVGARVGLDGEPLAAVDHYAVGRNRRPWVGGLLGLVPGLGYAYAGETGNALRSLFLNSLFIWGLVETAEDDQWAVFSVLAFAEFTWYSGSIYGGIDAAHRYNQRRLDRTVEEVRGGTRPRPSHTVVPVLTIRFDF
jgi:hypothetical protein